MTNPNILQKVQETILEIEEKLTEENGANEAYSAFTELIHSDMSEKLKCLHTRSSEFKGNKLKYKKYWNDELERQWSRVRDKERIWLKCNDINKKRLESDNCAERKIFDKLNRRYKRQYQRNQQDKLSNLVENDISRDFFGRK